MMRLITMKLTCLICTLQEMRYELAHLAHGCCDIDKFRVETCCVIGKLDFFTNHENDSFKFKEKGFTIE